MRKVTLRDVGMRLGLSHVAISLALRGTGRISDATREIIKRTAVEMGYRPDLSARCLNERRLRRRKDRIHAGLAWLNFWPDPKQLRSYKEFDLYWQGAFNAAEEAGYRLEAFDVNEALTVARLQRVLLTRNINGIIVPPQPVVTDLSGIDWSRFSGVRITHSVPTVQLYVVAPDKVYNGELAYIQTKSLGYKRVGFISWATGGRISPSLFMGGYLLRHLNDPAETRIPPLLLEQRDQDTDAKAVMKWIEQFRPDAILTDLSQARALVTGTGLVVGKDIGLAAMSVLDGNADAGIYQNPELIGRAASEVLVSLINRRETGGSPDFRSDLIRGSWVDGRSMPERRVR